MEISVFVPLSHSDVIFKVSLSASDGAGPKYVCHQNTGNYFNAVHVSK